MTPSAAIEALRAIHRPRTYTISHGRVTNGQGGADSQFTGCTACRWETTAWPCPTIELLDRVDA